MSKFENGTLAKLVSKTEAKTGLRFGRNPFNVVPDVYNVELNELPTAVKTKSGKLLFVANGTATGSSGNQLQLGAVVNSDKTVNGFKTSKKGLNCLAIPNDPKVFGLYESGSMTVTVKEGEFPQYSETVTDEDEKTETDGVDYSTMKVKELRQLASENGITDAEDLSKKELIEALKEQS